MKNGPGVSQICLLCFPPPLLSQPSLPFVLLTLVPLWLDSTWSFSLLHEDLCFERKFRVLVWRPLTSKTPHTHAPSPSFGWSLLSPRPPPGPAQGPAPSSVPSHLVLGCRCFDPNAVCAVWGDSLPLVVRCCLPDFGCAIPDPRSLLWSI